MFTSPKKIYALDSLVENILADGTIVYTEKPLNAPAITALNDKSIRALVEEGFITVKDLVNLADEDIGFSKDPAYQNDVHARQEKPLRLLQTPKVQELIRNGNIKPNSSLKQELSKFSSSSIEALSDPYILELLDKGDMTLEQIKKMSDELYAMLQMLKIHPDQGSNPITVQELVKCNFLELNTLAAALQDKSITDLLANHFITMRGLYEAVKIKAGRQIASFSLDRQKIQPEMYNLKSWRDIPNIDNLKIPAVCELIKSQQITSHQALKLDRNTAAVLLNPEVVSLVNPDIIPLEDFLKLKGEEAGILEIPSLRDYIRTKRFILDIPMPARPPIWNVRKAFSDANILALIDKGMLSPKQVFYMSPIAFKLLQISAVQELLLADKISAEDVLDTPYIEGHPVVAAFKNPDIIALITKGLITPQDLLTISTSSDFDTLNDLVARNKWLEERKLEASLAELSLEEAAKYIEHLPTVLSPQEIIQEGERKNIQSEPALFPLLNGLSWIAAPILTLLLGAQNTSHEPPSTPRIGTDEASPSVEPVADTTSFLTPQTLIPVAVTAGVCAATAVCFWKRAARSEEPASQQTTPRLE